MSQKKKKKERKQKKELLEQLEPIEAVKKPLFVRLYDKVLPGDYTRKQDLHHMIAVFVVFLIIVGGLAFIFYANTQKSANSVSTKLLIPKTSFFYGQEQNVIDMLSGYDFKNIQMDEEGNIVCYGTQEMVDQYKKSYEDDILAPVKESMLQDRSEMSIAAISLSDDAKTLTIKTNDDLSQASASMNFAVADEGVNKIIYVCSNWCQIKNDGEKMTVNIELVGSKEPYYSGQPTSGAMIVSEIEAKENSQSQGESEDGSGTSDTGKEDGEFVGPVLK